MLQGILDEVTAKHDDLAAFYQSMDVSCQSLSSQLSSYASNEASVIASKEATRIEQSALAASLQADIDALMGQENSAQQGYDSAVFKRASAHTDWLNESFDIRAQHDTVVEALKVLQNVGQAEINTSSDVSAFVVRAQHEAHSRGRSRSSTSSSSPGLDEIVGRFMHMETTLARDKEATENEYKGADSDYLDVVFKKADRLSSLHEQIGRKEAERAEAESNANIANHEKQVRQSLVNRFQSVEGQLGQLCGSSTSELAKASADVAAQVAQLDAEIQAVMAQMTSLTEIQEAQSVNSSSNSTEFSNSSNASASEATLANSSANASANPSLFMKKANSKTAYALVQQRQGMTLSSAARRQRGDGLSNSSQPTDFASCVDEKQRLMLHISLAQEKLRGFEADEVNLTNLQDAHALWTYTVQIQKGVLDDYVQAFDADFQGQGADAASALASVVADSLLELDSVEERVEAFANSSAGAAPSGVASLESGLSGIRATLQALQNTSASHATALEAGRSGFQAFFSSTGDSLDALAAELAVNETALQAPLDEAEQGQHDSQKELTQLQAELDAIHQLCEQFRSQESGTPLKHSSYSH